MMNKFLISLATIAAVTFGGGDIANANHINTLIEGEPYKYTRASFCVDEESAVSVIKDLKVNGMDSSVEVYLNLVAEEKCVSDTDGGVFTPWRLIFEYKDAIVVEGANDGVTVYFVSPNSTYTKGGEPV